MPSSRPTTPHPARDSAERPEPVEEITHDELARQVAAAGLRRRRDVMLDARLVDETPKDEYISTPIMINDNLIDLGVRPGAVGQTAMVEWRPQTAAYTVQSPVRTVAAGGAAEVTVTRPRPAGIVLEGTIPAGGDTLLIEAPGRQGVAVDVAPLGPNPVARLSPAGSYAAADRVALHRSLSFSQTINLINKVSMNPHVDTLSMRSAAKSTVIRSGFCSR